MLTPDNALLWVRRMTLAVVAIVAAAGCKGYTRKPETPVTRYQSLPDKIVPAYMSGTVLERVDLMDVTPQLVSGFGLVVNLQETGDNTQVATQVREYMLREMVKRGIGSALQPGFERTTPEDVLRDPRTAIVRVDALLPPGARRGDSVDVRVGAISTSATSSLARGELYRTELKIGGANPAAPSIPLDTMVLAQGSVFVNPVYALQSEHGEPAARRSLRTGWIMDGGQVMTSRPLLMRLRSPERRMARAIEQRIDGRYAAWKENQRDRIAAAQDEGIVRVTIPPLFRGDWEHFVGLCTHVYFDSSPQFISLKSRELAEVAITEGAPLLDISFCWEALGPGALPYVIPLMTHEKPDVAYAAARAAAFLGDPGAPRILAQMSAADGHPFQINAVRVLGELPSSPAISALVHDLLDSDQTLVRIEAYDVLCRQKDPSIYSRVINERFVLDVVPAGGAPLVYASCRGVPRIAMIGPQTGLRQPFNFTTFDNRLTLVSDAREKGVTIYYRPPDGKDPIKALSRADLAELVARLGGDRASISGLEFCYGDIVAILQAMSDQQHLAAVADGRILPSAFVLQAAPSLAESIIDAPGVPEQSRPAGDGAQTSVAEPQPEAPAPTAPTVPADGSRPN